MERGRGAASGCARAGGLGAFFLDHFKLGLLDFTDLVVGVGAVAGAGEMADDLLQGVACSTEVLEVGEVHVGDAEHDEGGIVHRPVFALQVVAQNLERGLGIVKAISLYFGDFCDGKGIVRIFLEHFLIVRDGTWVVALRNAGCGLGHFIGLDFFTRRKEGLAHGVAKPGDDEFHHEDACCEADDDDADELHAITGFLEGIPDQGKNQDGERG